MKSTAPWSGLRGPMTCDLGPAPLASPSSAYHTHQAPGLDHVDLLSGASFSALGLALSSAWNILSPAPSGVAGCFSNFESRFQVSHLREAFLGHLGPPTPPPSHIPAGIPAWNGVFICLIVFALLPSLFQGRNCLIYLPLYPYIKNKKVLNLVFNSYSNSLKFSFTRLS